MHIRIFLCCIIILPASMISYGQTVGCYSQYQLTPTLVNPAHAGIAEDIQVGLHYRKQSLSGDMGFSTAALSFLYPLFRKENNVNNPYKGNFNLTILQEKSGENGMLQTSEVIGGAAYNLDISQTNFLAVGLQGAYFYQAINTSRITTDNQYINNSYDPSAPHGEFFDVTRRGTLQFNTGLTWVATDQTHKPVFWLGAAISNLTREQTGLLPTSERSNLIFVADGGIALRRRGKLTITPTARFIRLGQAQQFNAGAMMTYSLNSNANSITLGSWYSLQRALIFSLIYSTGSYGAAIAWDQSINDEYQGEPTNDAVEVHLFWKIKRADNSQ